VIKTYKYRIYPNKSQTKTLTEHLRLCQQFYNAALQERSEAYKKQKISVHKFDQYRQIKEIRQLCPEYQSVYSNCLGDCLDRLDKAFAAFFRRIKKGEKPGYPKYQSYKRYNSLTYKSGQGFKILGDRISLSKIGNVKIRYDREVPSKPKTCTVKKEFNKWFVCLACEYEVKRNSSDQVEIEKKEIGLDLGVESFATDNQGKHYKNPKCYRKAESKLKKLQAKYSKTRNQKHRAKLNRAHEKVKNQRNDFHHKLSRFFVDGYDKIVVEDLNAHQMANKNNLDAGWTQFVNFLEYKCLEAGKELVKVNPAYTSQTCPQCGKRKKKTLAERKHVCDCGCKMHRDHAAAINILRLAE